MKKALTIFIIVFSSVLLFSQAPNSFNYQAVVRNNNGGLVTSSTVGFRISILQSSETGTPVYVESHSVSTDEYGLVTFYIGGGTTTDDFSAINWGVDSYFLKIELDVAGGTDYEHIGTSKLLSVPYALSAANVENKEFDSLEITKKINIGDGLQINRIYELTGMTSDTENFVWVELPQGMTAIQTRVLDLSIYFYVFQGVGVYYGLGSTESNGTVGYTLHRSNSTPCCNLKIIYPDLLRNKPYRITLMQVEGSVPIE